MCGDDHIRRVWKHPQKGMEKMEQNENLRNETSRRKPFVKALVAVLVAALAAFVLLPITTTKSYAADPVTVTDWKQLREAISRAPEGQETVIEIADNIIANSTDVDRGTMKIGGAKHITLKAKDNGKYTIFRKEGDSNFTLFQMSNANGSLTLGTGLTLSGKFGKCDPGQAGTVEAVPGDKGYDSVTPGKHILTEYEKPSLGNKYFAFATGGNSSALTMVTLSEG